MAYDEYLADRIRITLKRRNTFFTELKMMGGLCFKVDDKMLCGIHVDKKLGDNLLMARIGETAYLHELENEHALPMDFTGRPMKGYIFVTPQGFDSDAQLEHWIDLCLVFNPEAKASKKKTAKKKK